MAERFDPEGPCPLAVRARSDHNFEVEWFPRWDGQVYVQPWGIGMVQRLIEPEEDAAKRTA